MIRSLLALAALLSAASPAAAQQRLKTDPPIGDRQWASEGPLFVFAAPWCADKDKTLVAGRDYANSVAWTKGSMAAGVQLTWRWPALSRRKIGCGVYGYNQLSWGSYEGGATMTPVTPLRIGAIEDLTFSYEVQVSANVANYNGLIEFYADRQAGKPDSKAVEIGWYWHAPAETQAWARTGRQLGIFVDRYRVSWWVSANPGGAAGMFVTFTPVLGDRTKGSIDAKGALDFLRAVGLVDPNWSIAGVAIGVEPLGGIGTVNVQSWTVKSR